MVSVDGARSRKRHNAVVFMDVWTSRPRTVSLAWHNNGCLRGMSGTVASLEWVSPGAATEGVTPIFTGKNWRPFFSHKRNVCQSTNSPVSPLFIFSCKNWRPICSTLSLFIVFFLNFTRVSTPGGCNAAPFYLSALICLFFFVNLPTNCFSGVTPWRMSPGAVRPRPSSDATGPGKSFRRMAGGRCWGKVLKIFIHQTKYIR